MSQSGQQGRGPHRKGDVCVKLALDSVRWSQKRRLLSMHNSVRAHWLDGHLRLVLSVQMFTSDGARRK